MIYNIYVTIMCTCNKFIYFSKCETNIQHLMLDFHKEIKVAQTEKYKITLTANILKSMINHYNIWRLMYIWMI